MEKEKLLKTIILLGILSVVLIAHFNYSDQTNSIDTRNYGTETVIINYNPIEYYTNETLELLPPGWLLKLNNISLNKSF